MGHADYSGTAYAAGTADCRIGGGTGTCAFTPTAADGGKNTGSLTLTCTTTVGGTILAGHVTVSATTGGNRHHLGWAAASTAGAGGGRAGDGRFEVAAHRDRCVHLAGGASSPVLSRGHRSGLAGCGGGARVVAHAVCRRCDPAGLRRCA
ncbi:hypothetical protein [Kitasatospora sp. CB02891]|uniref:hypothetical protein n=1 Tax=Kitasatospora sp. CB02891 TaxID=2020329 RepID=UPI000C279A81|nr:hypothetical protein [Kitasatospora sp. CB02891]PJN25616.1 hypothetical protein CG736_14610 [Kitasatospora sp. CB02891]